MKPTEPIPQLRLRAPLWTALVPLLLLLQLFSPHKVWMVLLIGLGGAWLVALFWALALKSGLRLEREMRYGWAHVGDRLEERFTLHNSAMFPALWVEIDAGSSLPGYRASQVTGIGSQTQNAWSTAYRCTRRGLYTLGPTRLRAGDPLGMFEVSLEQPGSTVLMVTPPVVPLPAIEVVPGGRAGEGRRARRDPFERTVGARGARPYQPGDPLRWIHWPLSAHRGEFFVRLFDSTPASDWWIFLDLDAACQAGQGSAATEEHAVILAASLADRGLRLGRAVGLAAAGESLVWLPPSRASDHRLQILRALALARTGVVPLAQLLETSRPALQRGASLVVITPNSSLDWLEPLSYHIHSQVVPTVLLLDVNSYGGQADLAPIQHGLLRLGAAPYLVQRELLDRPEAHPGHQGEWEWKVTGFGRAIPLRKPSDLSWHKVGGG